MDVFDGYVFRFEYVKKGIDVILNEVHVITSLIRDMNRQDEIEEEWQVLAKVLDRMFFVLFTIM